MSVEAAADQLKQTVENRYGATWSSPIEGSAKRKFFAVLRSDAINSPVNAVRGGYRGGTQS